MVTVVKARVLDFASGPVSNLAPFTLRVFNMMSKNEAYIAFQSDYTLLQKEYETLVEAEAAATKGNSEYITSQKNDAVKAVRDRLRNIVGKFNILPDLTETFVLGAGLFTTASPTNQLTRPNPPTVVEAKSTGIVGQLLVIVQKDPNATGAVKLAFEYSLDSGKSWVNGHYSGRMRTVLDSLPSSPEMLMRVRILASRNRVSDWSQPTLCRVL